MTYDARQIANWFVTRTQRDKRPVSIMTLLKLTYIAHGWHLETQNAPLFSNRIEAWQYGPVIPDVYNAFRQQGIHVSKPVNMDEVQLAQDDEGLLEQVYNIYGRLRPFHLSWLIHAPGGPWDIATKTGGYYAPIPNELIRQHYALKREPKLMRLTDDDIKRANDPARPWCLAFRNNAPIWDLLRAAMFEPCRVAVAGPPWQDTQ